MSEKSSENSEMSDTAIAAERIRLVTPRDHRPVSDWINATARRLGWGVNRTKSVWYGEARRIEAREMREIENAIGRSELEQARRARAELAARVEKLEAIVAAHLAGAPGEVDDVRSRALRRLDRS